MMNSSIIGAEALAKVISSVADTKNELEDVLKTYNFLTNSMLDKVLLRQNDGTVDINIIEQNIKHLKEKYVLVEKMDLLKLEKKVCQLKDSLPKMLTKDILQAPLKLMEKKSENKKLFSDKQSLDREIQLIRKRYNSILSEVEQERQKEVQSYMDLVQAYRKQVTDLTLMCSEQSEYCAKLGGATCALLWRVSQQEDVMQVMLNGGTGKEFLQLSIHTLDSYSAAIQDKHANLNDSNNEHRFIIALIGVITNITASPFGREFVVSSTEGKELLDIMAFLLNCLSMKENLWMKLRNLLIKIFYNISINQKGLKLLCSKKEVLSTVSSIVEEDQCADNRIQAIRLLQSILCEADCSEASRAIFEMMPAEKLHTMIQASRGEVKSCFEELLTDIRLIEREQ